MEGLAPGQLMDGEEVVIDEQMQMRSNPRLVDATNTESFSHFEQEMLLFNEQERMQRQMAKQRKMLDVP